MFFTDKHTYYHTCPLCGANLDPDESCDCQNEDNTDSNVTEKSEDTINERKNLKDECSCKW